jgi:hypothetical protein
MEGEIAILVLVEDNIDDSTARNRVLPDPVSDAGGKLLETDEAPSGAASEGSVGDGGVRMSAMAALIASCVRPLTVVVFGVSLPLMLMLCCIVALLS